MGCRLYPCISDFIIDWGRPSVVGCRVPQKITPSLIPPRFAPGTRTSVEASHFLWKRLMEDLF